MYPGKEEYGLKLETHNVADLYPQYKVDKNVWYIFQTLHMGSHCGTHIEFPYHHNPNGLDGANFPLDRLIGDCLLLDFSHKKPNEAVTLREMKANDGNIRVNDMLLFNFDCAKFYGTPASHERPYIAYAAIQWLVFEKKISLIGSDASGIEVKGAPNQPNHQLLMDNQIPIIEFAANLDKLSTERFTLFILPLPIVGLDSCPVRLIAVENE